METLAFPQHSRPSRMFYLRTLRETMITYLHAKVNHADWHAVCDAANDLREIEAELKGLENG